MKKVAYHLGQAALVVAYPIALIAGFIAMCFIAYGAWLLTVGALGAAWELISGH